MDTDDNSLTVRNISNVLVDVDNWELVGVELGIRQTKLSEIRSNRQNNAALCKISMADTWLRRDVDATWKKLADALEKLEYDVEAKKIRENYEDGPGAGATANTRRTASGSAAGANSKRAQVKPVAQEVAPDAHLKKLFETPPPAGEEGRRMEEVLRFVIANDDLDINHMCIDLNRLRETLLHYSIRKSDVASMKALIALGADINLPNNMKMTPLDVANNMHPEDETMAQVLRYAGGVSNLEMVPQPETGGAQRMDTGGAQQGGGGEEQTMSNVGDKVLCLDNSSTMALVQLELLGQIEKATGKKITELFDWIVASGIGGLLVLLMVYGGKSIPELRHFYYRLYDQVFANPDVVDKGKELEAMVNSELGSVNTAGNAVYMQSVKKPKLLIGAVNKRMSILALNFFSNCPSIQEDDMHVWKVARFTCSSPFFIGEYDNYIDTGVLCKNLCGVGLKKINTHYEQIEQTHVAMVVSIGDGISPAQPLASTDQLSPYCSGSTKLKSSKDMLSVVRNIVALYNSAASSQSEEMSSALCERWCEARDTRFIRFNPLLEEKIPVPEEAGIEALINVAIQAISHVATGDGKEKMKKMKEEL